MTVYNWADGTTTKPARIYNRYGELPKRICWIDTDTGVYERYKTDENDYPILNEAKTEVVTIRGTSPLPVWVEWIDD